MNTNYKDEEGCFVYRMLKSVAVRSALNVGDECKTKLSFNCGDLVSVNLIRQSRVTGSNNGPFLRLSDCSGWLFERKYGEKMMERLTVTEGLWAMYADNKNTGTALRRHPFDNSPKMEPSTAYLPMQKIYCDRRVVHPNSGVVSYRVQGTGGWVFDKRISANKESFMLLPEKSVKKGLFIYEVLSALAIRSRPSTSDGAKTSVIVNENELISCNAIRESPYNSGNGPFVRLTDGSGWLFKHKENCSDVFLKQVSIEEGSWMFKVLNSPSGIALRRQPIDNKMHYDKTFKPEEIVTCDKKVKASTGVNFYRVKGTDGWVFDKRGDSPMLQLVQHKRNPDISSSSWDVNYIRGIAAASSLKEVMFNPESRVISFKGEESEARINIYYTTRTVGTAMDHPSRGKTQLFRRNCSDEELVAIMKDPRTHTGRGYYTKNRYIGESIEHTKFGPALFIEGEEELRNGVLQVDEQILQLQRRRSTMQNSLKLYDNKRMKVEEEVESKRLQRKKEELAREQAREEKRRIREDLTCSVCGRVFQNRHARNQHYNDVHVIRCHVCYREFNSEHSLYQHCDAVGHYW